MHGRSVNFTCINNSVRSQPRASFNISTILILITDCKFIAHMVFVVMYFYRPRNCCHWNVRECLQFSDLSAGLGNVNVLIMNIFDNNRSLVFCFTNLFDNLSVLSPPGRFRVSIRSTRYIGVHLSPPIGLGWMSCPVATRQLRPLRMRGYTFQPNYCFSNQIASEPSFNSTTVTE